MSFPSFVVDQHMYLSEYTGRGVRIAVIDSGVHATHPHVGGVAGGVAIREDGSLDDDYVDRLGHGTAVTAAIREKAPAAEIVAIKVFWRSLATGVPTLVRAIDEALARGATLINLSLGTTDTGHGSDLQAAVARASDRGAIIVAAQGENDSRPHFGGVREGRGDGNLRESEDFRPRLPRENDPENDSRPRFWLPGSLAGVVPVELDWSCARDAYRLVHADGRAVLAASGYPRDIPGVPRERNLKGLSFAVANATGFVARALEASAGARLPALFDTLEAAAANQTPG